MEIIDMLKENAKLTRDGKRLSFFARKKENLLLGEVSKLIYDFVIVAATFDYELLGDNIDNGFFPYLGALIEEAKTNDKWLDTTYEANAIGAAAFFSFLIIDNFPGKFNFKEVKGDIPHLVYIGDIDISFNLSQTMYDILKGNADISKLDNIYELCEALSEGKVTMENIGEFATLEGTSMNT